MVLTYLHAERNHCHDTLGLRASTSWSGPFPFGPCCGHSNSTYEAGCISSIATVPGDSQSDYSLQSNAMRPNRCVDAQDAASGANNRVPYVRSRRGAIIPHTTRTMIAPTIAPYAVYYNQSRTHLALNKDCPLERPIQRFGSVVAIPVLAGLHHQYARM
jgi:hypothetical protein